MPIHAIEVSEIENELKRLARSGETIVSVSWLGAPHKVTVVTTHSGELETR